VNPQAASPALRYTRLQDSGLNNQEGDKGMLRPTDKEMLTLAAITYRGINLVLPEAIKRAHLRRLMDDCMTKFSAVNRNWKIVWGPASFSTVTPGLDSSLMYVAQSLVEPSALAVAIRGTNPISLSDWVFGDFMVTHRFPWAYGDPESIRNASISASGALGLGILQHLRWDDAVLEAAPAAAASPAYLISPTSPNDWFKAVQSRLQSSTATSLLQTITSNFSNARTGSLDLHSLLQKEQDAQPAGGMDLKDFLRKHVASYPDCAVFVTGHSKGGALSSTLALWLADTRGPQTDPRELWNSDPAAPVYAWSFAGPTAGNHEFAIHSDATLTGCHRIWNRLDIVPHAFVTTELQNVSVQYRLNSFEKGILDGLIKRVVDAVGPLNYTQICGSGTPFESTLIPDLPFPLQLLHQHLDSYLAELRLSDEMSAASLLAPVL
jgi:lipase (class 3)